MEEKMKQKNALRGEKGYLQQLAEYAVVEMSGGVSEMSGMGLMIDTVQTGYLGGADIIVNMKNSHGHCWYEGQQ